MATCTVRQPVLAGCRATAGPRAGSRRRMQPVRAAGEVVKVRRGMLDELMHQGCSTCRSNCCGRQCCRQRESEHRPRLHPTGRPLSSASGLSTSPTESTIQITSASLTQPCVTASRVPVSGSCCRPAVAMCKAGTAASAAVSGVSQKAWVAERLHTASLVGGRLSTVLVQQLGSRLAASRCRCVCSGSCGYQAGKYHAGVLLSCLADWCCRCSKLLLQVPPSHRRRSWKSPRS